MRHNIRLQVRICAYPAHWLVNIAGQENPEYDTDIIWSTGETTEPGDIQVMAISSTLGDADTLKDDWRRDAVHSIWRTVSYPLPEYGNGQWPVQARLKRLVKLEVPVPKADLIKAGILIGQWPHHWRGKVLQSKSDIKKLGRILARKNPQQRQTIMDALGL